MTELSFTIFEGPDAGTTFFVRGAAVTLGRDAKREVVLHDDRASRLHTRIFLREGRAVVADEGSSNGTFVNGEMIRERELQVGDILAIGGNFILFGQKTPPPDWREILSRALAKASHPDMAGVATSVFPGSAEPQLNFVETPQIEMLEKVARTAQTLAGVRGVAVLVEMATSSNLARQVKVDRNLLQRALSELVQRLLTVIPAGDARLALRYGPDPARGGFQIEFIVVEPAVSREKIQTLERAHAFAETISVAQAHGGVFELLPGDADLLARVRLPMEPRSERGTIIRKGQ